MAETNYPSGNDGKYEVTMKEVSIADPGIAFTLNVSPMAGQTPTIPGGMQVNLDIYQGSEQTAHSSSLTIQNDIKDDYLTFVMPFGDPEYQVGDTFSYELRISFPGVSGAEQIVFPRQTGIPGLGGRFDFIDVPYILHQGEHLMPGQYIRSKSNKYFGLMNYDGAFVIYSGLNPRAIENATPVFTSGTAQNKKVYAMITMQEDGNVCIYGDGFTACALGSIRGNNAFGGYFFIGDDGKPYVYDDIGLYQQGRNKNVEIHFN